MAKELLEQEPARQASLIARIVTIGFLIISLTDA